MNATMTELLEALRLQLAENTPAERVFLYAQKTQEPVVVTLFPTIILSHNVLNTTDVWQRKAQGVGLHRWTASIDVYLGHRTLPDYQVEQLTRPWYNALAQAIMTDTTISGTAYTVGDLTELMTFQTGMLQWYEQGSKRVAEYWGIHAELQVSQGHTVPIDY